MRPTMFLIVSFCLLQLISADNNQDISSVLTHMTSMQGMLSNLQSKLQATESELAYLKSSQQSTESVLESVRTELKMTQTKLQATESELANLKSSQQSTESELESVRTELKYVKVKLDSSQLMTNQTQLHVQETQLELAFLNSSQQSIENEIGSVRTELRSVRSKLDSTEASVKSELLERGRRFAFEVLLSKDYSKTFVSNEVLKFDYVPLNIGNAYNPSSGILVVPEKGTYLIWANVLSNGRGTVNLKLMKGGNVLTRGYSGDDAVDGTANINHVLQLEKGDHVWFSVESTATVRGSSYSSFGGILMYP